MPSPFVIKLNIFVLYGSASCVIPYLSVYLLHYTNASFKELGLVMVVSSIFTMPFSLVLRLAADRYRAHRCVYLITLIIALVSFSALLCPILLNHHNGGAISTPPSLLEPQVTVKIDKDHQLQSGAKLDLDGTNYNVINNDQAYDQSPDNSRVWLGTVGLCMVLGTMATTVNMNLSDTFCASIAPKCNKSYGSVRSWGAGGWIAAAMVLAFTNKIQSVPLLVPALFMFVALAAFNVLVIAFWPDKEPFDCSERAEPHASGGPKFKFIQRFLLGKQTLANCADDIEIVTREMGSRASSVVMKSNRTTLFDTRDEDVFRNIRRCSLAPLGDSFVIKQFELDETSGKHFCHVTKIETREKASEKCSDFPMMTINEYNVDSMANDIANLNLTLQASASACRSGQESLDADERANRTTTGLLFYLRLLAMMKPEDKREILKFWILFMLNGFTAAMNWFYLFPYLESLDADKFRSLSANVMVGGHLSETLFYYIAQQFTKSVKSSASLSLILLIYGARYSFYLIFVLYRGIVPLELIVVIEALQAINMGWFNCVFYDLALEFALKARECVPELVELGQIDDSQETMDKVNNGLELTIVSISSCCFDGIGLAAGALVGGWLIDDYDFVTLWLVGAFVAYCSGLVNILLDLSKLFYSNNNKSQPSINGGK